MSDEEEHDFAIEKADAGASATIPMEAGQIKKGGYVVMMGVIFSMCSSGGQNSSIGTSYNLVLRASASQ